MPRSRTEKPQGTSRGATSAAPRIPDPLHDLALLIRSRYGLIHLETAEEGRAESLLRHLADHLSLPLFVWRRRKGLQRADAQGPVYGTETLAGALGHVEAARFPALYHFKSLGAALQDAGLVEQLRDAAAPYEKGEGALVLTGTDFQIPQTLRARTALVQLPAPTLEDYKKLLSHIYRDLWQRMHVQSEMRKSDLAKLLNNLKGLTLLEAEKILTKAMVEDGKLSPGDIQLVIDAKKEIVEREGLLEYFPVEESMTNVAGLRGLKEWLQQRRKIILDPERAASFGLSFPKGVLLLGVPGCGKSLCAKAVATEWRLPLLKLDPANLYNKYVGESERNFKRAIATAERCAPVILWIDELEKAFASVGGDHDGGTSTRVFGTFLSWMQDHKEHVFVVATANDVAQLPPEFLRKGRFDEIFFVDLPDAESREAIFRIHLSKRGQDPDQFEVGQLVEASAGFSGAEIEQVVVAALFAAFSSRTPLTSKDLMQEVASTQPIAVTMGEKIAELRAWARDRVRNAH
ncbi:MAG: AAA family ATPase [Candidatus Latescibacterota bacterium]|nr:MAG: AAA family ATPase [Candidatus Latescibacterota bacterium]